MRNQSLRKAAVLVASLDQTTADMLLEQMGPQQADHVRRAILHLGEVDPDEQREVIDEFFHIGPLVPQQHPPGIELDGELARQLAFPQAEPPVGQDFGLTTPDDDRGCSPPPFRFLHETEFENLAPFLRREHPQTIAVVVSHLPPERASELLTHLPPSLQVEVIRRLADLDEAEPRVLQEVERGLQKWLSEQVQHRRRRAAGLAAVSAILDASPVEARRNIMASLNRHDRPLAGKLRTVKYTFSDWMQQSDAAVLGVIRAAQPEMIVLALAGATAEFVERVLQLLPADQSRTLKRALAHLGPTRLTDVEEAQQALADLATELEISGGATTQNGVLLQAA